MFKWYNLIVSYAGEGGRYLQVEGEEAFPSFPPPPIGAALPGQPPERRGAVGPLSVVSPIADGWGSVVAAQLRGRCPSLGAQEFGRAD